MHVGMYLHLLISYDICCAFEEPHTPVNVVLPYWFAPESVEFSGHVYAVCLDALQESVLMDQFGSRQSYRYHSDVMMPLSVKLGKEFLLPSD